MIIRNSARCKLCGDHIESTHRHDFRSCKCGEIFVDGGKAYLRRGAKDLNSIEDTSIIKDDDKPLSEEAKESIDKAYEEVQEMYSHTNKKGELIEQ